MENYTTSTAFLEALQEAGVSYLFSNFGSDHPAMIEALAQAEKEGKKLPKVITCPHEMVALSAAHGYAQVSGEPQAVIVHVECGTQNLGAAIHNAWKGRVPVLVFAGTSPYTQEGELLGSRNEFIHWIQDVPDQRGIVRGYMKYDNEIRTGTNVKQMVHRALQIAKSGPKGPVYLVGAREVMEEETTKVNLNTELWEPIAPSAIAPKDIGPFIEDLRKAEHPLVVTSYLGKNKQAVEELVKFCDKMAIPVLESVPNYMNFPSDNPLHCGYQWNTPGQNDLLSKADFILAIDSDVPWIPFKNKPSKNAVIYYIDEDPLKEGMPLWYIPSRRFFAADAETALQQINDSLSLTEINERKIEQRRKEIKDYHLQQRQEQEEAEKYPEEALTPEYVLASVREIVDEDTIVTNELISSYQASYTHLNMTKPGSILGSGAGGLGWNGGAAVGAKLADPTKTIINLAGDGCYMFSVPSAVYWVARKYDAPILTIIFNNRGWNSPKLSTLGVHPDGVANETDQFFVDFTPHADLSKIAEAAGGAYARKIEKPEEMKGALKEALDVVRSGQSAVLDVYLPAIKKNKFEKENEEHATV
ncbi:acetolactate synthase-1/2/3 large subunit [Virgibacillus natechei]|uniref:Acetolactate synthase-1/2/3 large subunit n=1 Tax=Virgibacillus natechei TaxID=1216297 RepID=A0ABS4IJU9_9BACI|nr:thiamine pyrophosphate-requiring protein [Virgibacillus natechei]MBP1971233.1 acetolactate synthase-1/2/3 large subunit [Virgibacillus natechei]UZD12136.1 thiamine pyrophosphate-requiring protein [Virgibacillus natechei]